MLCLDEIHLLTRFPKNEFPVRGFFPLSVSVSRGIRARMLCKLDQRGDWQLCWKKLTPDRSFRNIAVNLLLTILETQCSDCPT